MHSRIFQIDEKPIPSEKLIGDEDIPEYFYTNGNADYWDTILSPEQIPEEKEWLAGFLGTKLEEDGTLLLTKEVILKKLHADYLVFMKDIEKLLKLSFEDFQQTLCLDLYDANTVFDDKFGFYVFHTEDEEMETVDSFLRWTLSDLIVKKQEAKKIYLGSVIDYHF